MVSKEIVVVIVIMFLSFILGAVVMQIVNLIPDTINLSVKSKSNCSELNNTVMIAYCLNEEFNSFYFYNISNSGKSLNEEELKEEGGVCSHASKWYKERLQSMGFRAKEEKVFVNQTVGHVYTRFEAEDAYCILDQTDIFCFPYG